MKKLIASLLFGLIFLTAPVSMGAELLSIMSNSVYEIDLKGDLSNHRPRSLIKPVQAFITGQSIEVDFNTAMGAMELSVYDEEGNLVYLQSVNLIAGQRIFIDISSFEEGYYTIEFTNSQGWYLSGDFAIE